jgi:hypothetical protein
MSEFITNLGYIPGQYIYATIQAQNGKGNSIVSNPNDPTIQVQSVPSASPQVLTNYTSTDTEISLSWSPLTFGERTGYSFITQYEITWD